jgi:trimeric autotransporter adhesin
MARKFLVSVDLNKNELLNARIQNLGVAPSNPVSGQIYYNTGTNVLYFYNGTEWTPASGSTEVIQDLIGSSVIAGTALTSTYDDTEGTTTLKLNDTAVTAGSYGSTTAIPTFTVDAQGRLTAAGTVNVATNLSVAGDSGTDTVDLLTDTLTVAGGEGIDVAVTNNTITVSAEDASYTNKGVASFSETDFTVTAGAVSLNKDPVITLSGDVTGSATMTNLGDVTISTTIEPNSVALGTDTTGSYVSTIAGTTGEITVSGSGSESAAVTIGLPDDVTIAGDLTINGNLDVQGSINSISTTEVNIVDTKVVLNTNVTGAPSTDAGLKVNRGTSADVELLWNETSDQWTLTNDGTNYHEITRKYKTTLNTSATSYTLTHNLGTKDVVTSIYEVAAPYAEILADVEHTSDSDVTIKFAVAPASGEYRVVVIG